MAISISMDRGPTNSACAYCGKPPTKLIEGLTAPHEGLYLCAHCGDNLLIKTIKKCIEGIEEAKITMKIMPKGVMDAREKGGDGA
jgi:DNA-directed RNA polymerase subunit RPC12/RpoP